MLSRIKWILLWWKQRQNKKRLAILQRPNRSSLERCGDILEYLNKIEFTLSRQALRFYQTRLVAKDLSEFTYIIGHLNTLLKLKGGLIREEVLQLNNLYGDKEFSLTHFFGDDEFNKSFSTFSMVVNDFVKNLIALQRKENIESIHTLRIMSPFIEALKETLETLVRTTQ